MKIKQFIKKHYKRVLISVVSLILLIPAFIIPVSAKSISYSPSQQLIECFTFSQGFDEFTPTYSSSDSIHFDNWNAQATIPSGTKTFCYNFNKKIGLNVSAGENVYCKFPFYFNNNGVNSAGDEIREYLWIVTVFYRDDGISHSQDINLGKVNVALGIYNIEFSFSFDEDCDFIEQFSFYCSSDNGNFYKTTWGTSGFRALIGVADDILIYSGDDIPKYGAVDNTDLNKFESIENDINSANQEGLNTAIGFFDNFGSLFSNTGSIFKGLLAVTKIFNGFLGTQFLANLIDFVLALGLFAFLLGIGFLSGRLLSRSVGKDSGNSSRKGR